MRLKSIFGQISPPILLYHFLLLQEFDLKKPPSPFKDLHKFLKPIPAISFPRTGKKLLKMLQDHRELLIENKEE